MEARSLGPWIVAVAVGVGILAWWARPGRRGESASRVVAAGVPSIAGPGPELASPGDTTPPGPKRVSAESESVAAAMFEGYGVSLPAGPAVREPEPGPYRLTVLDARTRLELDRVEVLERRAAGAAAYLLPNESPEPKVLVSGAPSPVELAPGTFRRTLLVGRPGYAWGMVPRSAFRRGRDLSVELMPAGGLDVRLQGYETGYDGYLWLFEAGRDRHPNRRARLAIDDPAGQRIDPLPPADYVVRVQQGDPWNCVVLAEGSVRVRAHETAVLDLEVVAPATDAEKVPCSGVVVVPRGFPERHLRIEFAPAADLVGRQPTLDFSHFLPRRSALPTEVPFDVGPALPGRYSVRMTPLGSEIELVLPEHGDRNLRLEYPALHEVIVCVENPPTVPVGGPPHPSASFCPEGTGARGPARVELDPDTGCYRLSVPTGTLVLAAGGAMLRESEPLVVRPGRNVFNVTLKPLSKIDLRVFRDGQPARVAGLWNSARVSSKATGESRDAWTMVVSPERLLLHYPFEGECTLDLRPVGGELSDTEPIDVFLRRGEVELVEVRLGSEP